MKGVVVMVAADEMEAKVAKSLLESGGILCWLSSDVPPTVYPLTVNGLAETLVYVPEDQAGEARAILKESQSQTP